jgi:DNA-binding HxlR family transcriptional regulator
MERKSFGNMQCPIARTLERVGEWWSILILRDAFHGLTRFDQFQKSLDIAPNMLTRRLHSLVDAGLLERRQYTDRPPRFEYVLTDLGRDFRFVLLSLNAWGNKHFAPEGASVLLVDSETGAPADLMLVDRNSGKEVIPGAFKIVAGPQAEEGVLRRLSFASRKAANEGAVDYDGELDEDAIAAISKPAKTGSKKGAVKSAVKAAAKTLKLAEPDLKAKRKAASKQA